MRTRQHVNPLGLGFETFRGERPALRPGRPIEVEIGCADAQFLFERAAVDPERTYIGLEIRRLQVELVNERSARENVPVVAVFAAASHLREIVPRRSVARVYLNFPDPWFKKRHHNRRMIDRELALQVAEVLQPGGEVFFQSDVWEVALDALEVLERADDHFANCAGEWSFWREGNPYKARSWREENAEAEGLPVWRLRYRAI